MGPRRVGRVSVMSWQGLNKRELASLISSGTLEPFDLTFAVEHFGKIAFDDPTLARQILAPLLKHPDAVVREGVLYGLDGHLDEAIQREVFLMASNDPSKGVRQAAADLVSP